MTFLLATALLSLLAVGFVMYPFLSAGKSIKTLDSNSENLAIYRQNISELDKLVMANDIDLAEYRSRKQEFDVLLVSDYEQNPQVAVGKQLKPVWGILLASMVLLASGLVYRQLGALPAVQLSAEYQTLLQQPEVSELEMAKVLADITDYAKNSTDAGSWWYLAANGYAGRGDYAVAAEAYQHAAMQWPQDSRIWAELGQALYLGAGRKMTAAAEQALQQAVNIDPHQSTAQGVLGIAAFEQGNFAVAVSAWEQALRGLPPMSRQAGTLQAGIAQARLAMGNSPAAPSSDERQPNGTAARIELTVQLASQVPAREDQIVYVFAKAVAGPPMPLAVQRIKAGQLPIQLVLDDSSAMQQGMGISSQAEVEVVARLSQSGDPIGRPGDWQSQPVVIPTSGAATATVLVIDQQVE